MKNICRQFFESGQIPLLVELAQFALARSVSHLLDVIEDLTAKNAHFRSLRDPIDTTTPQGMFSPQVLGAVAQLERALISERTKAGIKAAKAKGRPPGNRVFRERRPDALDLEGKRVKVMPRGPTIQVAPI